MTVPVNHDIVLLPDPNVIFFSLGALNVVPRLILNVRSRRVRKPVSVALASCGERAVHRALRVTFICLLTLVC